MLALFRRYQKGIFFVVTFFVVISFCFFGTYGAIGQRDEERNQEIGMGLLGKPVLAREYRALSLLLSSSLWDRNGERGNLMNPGVIEKDFLATGLGAMLVKPYFAKMKPELDLRAKKIKQYRLYTHPRSPDLSLERIFSLVSPSLAKAYFDLKMRSDQATMETWVLLSQLYLEQTSLPSNETIRQFLLMQEEQKGIGHDETLSHVDLSLFGFKTIEDWFGPQFVPLVTSYIFQASQVAEERGFTLSNEEIRAELMNTIRQAYQREFRTKEIPHDEVQKYYVMKMRSLGLDEETLLASWKKVMLFERLFEEVGGNTYLDPLALQQFEEFAQEAREVKIYSLPSFLQFPDVLSLCRFQLYLESISPEGTALRKDPHLPTTFLSIQQIEKKTPSLIRHNIEIDWRSISLSEIVSQISLQETLAWQENNWALLCDRFPALHSFLTEDPIDALSLLTLADKKEIDRFAQEEIVKKDRGRLETALQEKSFSRIEGNLNAPQTLLAKIQGDEKNLLSLLKKTSCKGEEQNQEAILLQRYSPSSDRLDEIVVIARDQEKEIIPFSEAVQAGICDQLLNELLEKMYPDARRKNPVVFQTKEGGFRPFSEVKEEIAKVVFADVISSSSLLTAPLAALHEQVEQGKKEPLSFYPERKEPFLKELALETKIMTASRSLPFPFSKETLFSQEIASLSPLQYGAKGELGFYRVLEKKTFAVSSLAAIDEIHALLGEDAKKRFMSMLLKKIHEDRKIDLLSYAD